MNEATYKRAIHRLADDRVPTPEQREVTEFEDAATLVTTGAGSEKTATMASRIVYYVAAGRTSSEEVFSLTFTHKVVGELNQRVDRALGRLWVVGMPLHTRQTSRSSLARPTISAYNALMSDIAASYGMPVGADPMARLVINAERFQLTDSVVIEGAVDLDVASRRGRACIVEVALCPAAGGIDNGVSVERMREFFEGEAVALERLGKDLRRFTKSNTVDAGMESAEWERFKRDWRVPAKADFALQLACLPTVEAYTERKRSLGLVEFANQVVTASEMPGRHGRTGEETTSRHRLVLLDEHQGTFVSQAVFLRRAFGGAGEGRLVYTVGDPNQAIYGWRGAGADAPVDFAIAFAGEVPVRHLMLSTFPRFDAAILDAANAVAALLDEAAAGARKLKARPGCGPGRVVEARLLFAEDSYRAIARRVEDVQTGVARTCVVQPEIAVPCRKCPSIEWVADALCERGVAHEIVGGESLIERPETVTVCAALGVLAHPSHDGLLVRLLLHWGVGGDAMRAFCEWFWELARQSVGDAPLDPRAEAGLVKAVSRLSDPEWVGSRGLALDSATFDRLSLVSESLVSLRSSVHLSLADFAEKCVSQLGLGLVAASRVEDSQRVRTFLDLFVALARGYSAVYPGASVRDFVDWFDPVERHEYGGEEETGTDASEEVEVHAGVVQILTVHAVKGLEWRDLVAISEMVSTQFSEKESDKSWAADPSVFPFPLRTDRAHLPRLRPSDFSEKLDAALAYSRFLRADIPVCEDVEARRLAYVAFTRPQAELFLAGYGLTAKEIPPSFVEGDAAGLLPCSVFLDDIRKGAGVLPAADVADPEWSPELTEGCLATMPLTEATERTRGPSEPVIDYANADPPLWPVDAARADLGAGHTSEPGGSGGGFGDSGKSLAPPERVAMWRQSADLLIRERETASRPAVSERPHVTVTDVVHLNEDPAALLA